MAEIQNLVEATVDKKLQIKDKTEVGAILRWLETKVTDGDNMQKKYDDYLATFANKSALWQFAAIANRDLMDTKTGKGFELMRKLGLTPKVQDELKNRPDVSKDTVATAIEESRQALQPVSKESKTAQNDTIRVPFHLPQK